MADMIKLEEQVEAALHAKVPGGSEVWVWLPQKDAFTPSDTARDVIRAALLALSKENAKLKEANERLQTDLRRFDADEACEGCGAPMYQGDQYLRDMDGVAACWHSWVEPSVAGDKPCYAYRVGKPCGSRQALGETNG